jgi:hypothetical protein
LSWYTFPDELVRYTLRLAVLLPKLRPVTARVVFYHGVAGGGREAGDGGLTGGGVEVGEADCAAGEGSVGDCELVSAGCGACGYEELDLLVGDEGDLHLGSAEGDGE